MTSIVGLMRMVVTMKAGRFLREHRERELLKRSGVFDETEYLCRYPDVARTGMDPILHYLRHGAEEGRCAHPLFDEQWYVKTYPDVAASGMSPLVHFVQHGAREGRSPCADLDVPTYLKQHSFCLTHDVNPLAHVRLTEWYHRRPGSSARGKPHVHPESVRKRGDNGAGGSKAHPVSGPTVTREHLMAARAAVAGCTRPFSVIMPTWNRRSMISKAIDSVLAQTYPYFELIIADDGSTDGTRAFLESQYPEEIRNGRIRWVDGPHSGVSGARNRALAAASGDWVAYLDSDNTWRPDYLLCMASEFVTRPWRRTAYTGLRVNRGHTDQQLVFCRPFDWAQLSRQNFIDLNVFSHHRGLYDQLGGFDEGLHRLVDWELIIRYTELYPPAFVNAVLADYYIYKDTDHITTTEPLQINWDRVWAKHHVARLAHGSDEWRLAYVLWDFPALSQTFVLAEIRELVARGYDVKVYFHRAPDQAATLDFPIESVRFTNAEQLSIHLRRDRRNWIHSHFAYPAVTLAGFPAARECGIPFSFMPHAVDIFHHTNRTRNRLKEMTNDPLCRRVICYGPYHRSFLISQGVPASKVLMSSQAFQSLPAVRSSGSCEPRSRAGTRTRIVCIGRYIEKKGIEYLIRAMGMLDPDEFEADVYGYGPLESSYRKLIEELGVTNVRIHGPFQGDDERAAIYGSADLFVLPCVEAADGDVDGFPTVFLEAMSAGVPVVTTPVSANADFLSDGINALLCPPRDPAALAERIRWCRTQPPSVLERVRDHARSTVSLKCGSREVVDALLDCTVRAPLDIYMVTYHPTTETDYRRTLRIIDRVFEMTTTPFTLTVVDNASHDECVTALRRTARRHQNLRLIELPENVGCGPASNIAYRQARSDYVIYLCSNETCIARPGWERGLLSYMQTHPEVALAGHLIGSPRWTTGAEYMAQPWFRNFRNQEFARPRPDRVFRHVQGGVHILRREAFVKHGGFNDLVPNSQCDVELSYYLESCGWKLGDIPSVVSLTQKTRPTIHALIDEAVDVVHPVTADSDARLIEQCVSGRLRRCNITGWCESRDGILAEPGEIVEGFTCPETGSTGRSRALYRLLARSHWIYRDLRLGARLSDSSLIEPLRPMFNMTDVLVSAGEFNPGDGDGWVPPDGRPVDVAIISEIDLKALEAGRRGQSWLDRLIGETGTLVFGYRLSADTPPVARFKSLAREHGCTCHVEAATSRVNGYGLALLIIWSRRDGGCC